MSIGVRSCISLCPECSDVGGNESDPFSIPPRKSRDFYHSIYCERSRGIGRVSRVKVKLDIGIEPDLYPGKITQLNIGNVLRPELIGSMSGVVMLEKLSVENLANVKQVDS